MAGDSAGFGDKAISAYGIGFRVDSLAIMPVLGLGAGAVPLIGYFRGRKDFKGARKVQRYALKLVVMYGIGLGVIVFALAGIMPMMFTNDPDVLRMASDYFRIIAVSYPFFGIAIITSSAFQGLGKGMPSLVIMLSRTIMIAIPLCYYLANYTEWGLNGVILGIVVSAIASAAMAVVWIESVFKKLCGARK
jgi:Na+-driven multidrug efflux pump